MTTPRTTRNAFSLIELVMVVTIMGIIAAIAVPKFAEASSGRKLQAAKKALLADIEVAKLRARATSTQHTFKLYKNSEMYIIVEGNEIKRDAVVLARDFTKDPFNVLIKRSDLGGDEVIIITPEGDLSPSANIQLTYGKDSITVTLDGITSTGITPIITATETEVEDLDLVAGVLKSLGL